MADETIVTSRFPYHGEKSAPPFWSKTAAGSSPVFTTFLNY